MPPTVPTSFVPHPSSSSSKKGSDDMSTILATIGYGAFVIALILAGLVYGYLWTLTNQEVAKRAELETAKLAIDQSAVDSFVSLDHRLSNSTSLLNTHPILSNVLDLLESLSPTTVRLNGLTIAFDTSHKGMFTSTGLARSFNTLAVLTEALNKDTRIKNVSFTGTSIEKAGGVNFTLSATLDPKLTEFSVEPVDEESAPDTTTP